jgi:hypothetical protein
MRKEEFDSKLKYLCIEDKYELLEKYLYLLNEVKELKKFKATSRERYDKMNKALATYMEKYGSLDNRKGKQNGVHKQI